MRNVDVLVQVITTSTTISWSSCHCFIYVHWQKHYTRTGFLWWPDNEMVPVLGDSSAESTLEVMMIMMAEVEIDCCGWGPQQQQACRRPQEEQVVCFCSSDDNVRMFMSAFARRMADAVCCFKGWARQGVNGSLYTLRGFSLSLLPRIIPCPDQCLAANAYYNYNSRNNLPVPLLWHSCFTLSSVSQEVWWWFHITLACLWTVSSHTASQV